MLSKHVKAIERLHKALNHCHKAGLKGGVWDGSFYVWPIDAEPDPRDAGVRFFEAIREVGGDHVYTQMWLDGGAGT